MGQKHYSQAYKDEAVLYYERGHTFAETQVKYGMSESTFFDWKKNFDQSHPVSKIPGNSLSAARKLQRHQEKLLLELEVMRQCPCGVHASIDDKMEAINALKNRYSVHVMCDALNLSRGTYYNRKRREQQMSKHDADDAEMKPLIQQIFYESKQRFGRKPIHQKLLEMGYHISEKRICRLMKEMGLETAKPVYRAEHQKSLPRAYYKNILARQFDQPAPDLVWVSDITYVKVADQYYYICTVLDLFSRKILSCQISDTIDSALSIAAFDTAFEQRQKPKNLIFHSDQGAQYTAYVFRQHLRELRVKQSFSTPGNPYDNSVCESFFHTLKKEALYHHFYETPQALGEVLEEYIAFYNSYRPHRKLNMKTPIQYEAEFFSDACK